MPFHFHGRKHGNKKFFIQILLRRFGPSTKICFLLMGDDSNVYIDLDTPKRPDQEKCDPGIKSEGEEDSQTGNVVPKIKSGLGKTPNHLTLRYRNLSQATQRTAITNFVSLNSSTTSTLSAGSTGSQARLIQSSHPPENYQPAQLEELGKQNSKTVIKAEVHETRKVKSSPTRSPNKTTLTRRDSSPNQSKKPSPAQSRKSSPNQSRKTSPNRVGASSRKSTPNVSRNNSISPKMARRQSSESNGGPRIVRVDSNRSETDAKSPKKIKSSLKQPSRSLSIENPTCVECYLSGKTDKGQHSLSRSGSFRSERKLKSKYDEIRCQLIEKEINK